MGAASPTQGPEGNHSLRRLLCKSCCVWLPPEYALCMGSCCCCCIACMVHVAWKRLQHACAWASDQGACTTQVHVAARTQHFPAPRGMRLAAAWAHATHAQCAAASQCFLEARSGHSPGPWCQCSPARQIVDKLAVGKGWLASISTFYTVYTTGSAQGPDSRAQTRALPTAHLQGSRSRQAHCGPCC